MNYRSKSLMNRNAKKLNWWYLQVYKAEKLWVEWETRYKYIFYNIFVKSSKKGKMKSKVDFLHEWVKLSQLCLTLYDPMEFSRQEYRSGLPFPSPGDRMIRLPFPSPSQSQPRDWTQFSCIAGRLLTIWATRKAFIEWRKERQICQEEA